ncbi:MAG: hypothetical protein KC535_00515 [Nanoarchaeota archaeon]|nr:hypothetical protein [Nanoarchaeota archaeon]
MISKKAQLQIQFNWIFVIIVGSILLIFFFGLINNQSKTTDQRISISQSKYFETVITATGQKVGTLKEYDIPGLEVDFTCDAQGQVYDYSVEGLPARDTKYDIIFTQDQLIGDDIQAWTQIWETPFQAGTFLYLTNSKQGYIFYNYSKSVGLPDATTQFEELYEDFPHNISVELVDDDRFLFEDALKRNYESYTYIFLKGEEPSLDSDLIDESKKNLIILIQQGEGTTSLFDYGTVSFLSLSQYQEFLLKLRGAGDDEQEQEAAYAWLNQYSSSYLGKASLYGSIFSEDKEVYECNMQKAFTRLRLVTNLYYERVDDFLFNEDYQLSLACKQAMGKDDGVGPSAFFPHQRLAYLVSLLQEGFQKENVATIHYQLGELNDNNKQILGLSHCPPLY